MHFALMYFYSGLMCLICTNINFHFLYIVGFSKSFICQNTAKMVFLPPVLVQKREILSGMHFALMYFYNGLMCLICTNINFYFFYIVGFSKAFMSKYSKNGVFTPDFGLKKGNIDLKCILH
jgi:uncharacterized membrane protein